MLVQLHYGKSWKPTTGRIWQIKQIIRANFQAQRRVTDFCLITYRVIIASYLHKISEIQRISSIMDLTLISLSRRKQTSVATIRATRIEGSSRGGHSYAVLRKSEKNMIIANCRILVINTHRLIWERAGAWENNRLKTCTAEVEKILEERSHQLTDLICQYSSRLLIQRKIQSLISMLMVESQSLTFKALARKIIT